jgi:O-antigen/teichoic acid export membrane protein
MPTRSLPRKVFVALGGNMAAVVLQAVQFILLARILGAAEYGAFASVNALVSIVVPLAGLGYGNVMLMTVSRDRNAAPTQLGNSLAITAALGLVLVLAIVLAVQVVYGSKSNPALAMVIGLSELVLVRTCLVTGQFFQSIDKIKRLSLINVSISMCRVLAISGLLFSDAPQAINWAMISASLLLLLTLVHVPAAVREAGGLSLSLADMRRQWKDATYFALGTSAKAAYTDLDKVILGRTAPSAELGIYTTAYRLVVMAFIPVRSLLDVTASRFFKSGEAGVQHSFALSKKLIRFSVPYGIVVGVGLYVCSPLVPWILGPSYGNTADVLRWLAPLPAIQAVHYVLSDALTGAGYQRVRTLIQFLVLAVYAALGLWLIPSYGWHGAALVCIFSESLLAVLVVMAVVMLLRKP